MSFANAMQRLLDEEGGYSNNPMDHGGPTNHGITQHDLAVWRGKPVTAQDVKDMSVDEATAIYKAHYWDAINLPAIHSETLQEIIFNQGVLCGPQTVVMHLQRILMLKQDGKIGPVSLAAINAHPQPKVLAMQLMCDMQQRYVDIVLKNNSQIIFLHGWLRRTHAMMLECVS